MNNSCVVGYGMVGQATAKLFGIEKHYDLMPERSNMTFDEVLMCEVIFVCLPTPEIDGHYDTKDIWGLVEGVKTQGGNSLFVIRSTVNPGFADSLRSGLNANIVSNPEFLTEATWERDTQHPPFILLGTGKAEDNKYVNIIKGMYEGRIKSAPIIVTDSVTAEIAKLALNGFFTAKVVFANEIFDLCQSYKANYRIVKEIFERHPFGYKNHAEIFHKGGRGAGGKCLAKDMRVLASLSSSSVLAVINQVNQYLLKEYPKENGNTTA